MIYDSKLTRLLTGYAELDSDGNYPKANTTPKPTGLRYFSRVTKGKTEFRKLIGNIALYCEYSWDPDLATSTRLAARSGMAAKMRLKHIKSYIDDGSYDPEKKGKEFYAMKLILVAPDTEEEKLAIKWDDQKTFWSEVVKLSGGQMGNPTDSTNDSYLAFEKYEGSPLFDALFSRSARVGVLSDRTTWPTENLVIQKTVKTKILGVPIKIGGKIKMKISYCIY